MRRLVLHVLASSLVPSWMYGLILVGGGNSLNVTDPGSGVPWDQVARVTNSAGTHKTSGSAVYLGNGYMLTANHVNLSQGYVSFDGSTTYSIKTGSAVQVAAGVDLKVFELDTAPGFSGVQLIDEADLGDDITNAFDEYLVGWGVGHNPSDTDNPWSWGTAAATSDKRWGVNDVVDSVTLEYSHAGFDYEFESLVTSLGSDQGANEVAVTIYDSGSALFYFNGSDWLLSGVPVTVETNSISTFGIDTAVGSTEGRGDYNYFARVADYSDEINALIVPEPRSSALLLGVVSCLVLLTRRRLS